MRRFVNSLAITVIAVYALIVTGAVVATTGAGTGCSTWPICTGVADSVTTPELLLVFGHRLLSAIVGVLVLVTAILAWTTATIRRVRLLVTAGALAFPVQIGIGAVVVLTDIAFAARLHLAVAGAIFAVLLLALGWSLEGPASKTADADGQPLIADTTDQPATGESSNMTSVSANAPVEEQPGDAPLADERSPDGDQRIADRAVATAAAYLELTKPRLMWLLCLLALSGMALATMTTGVWPDGLTVVATLAGGVLAVGASGTFNHVFERDRDRKMARTADRPVATDQVSKANAGAFAVGLVVTSMLLLVVFVNALAAALTFVAIVYYSVVYTVVLKPNTSWNIAIGGGSGALPALIGWAAVTGAIGRPALVLAGIVVLWTPAHFYNLAIVYRDDYARADYPMFPVVFGVSAARRRIIITLGATLLATGALAYVTPLGMLFAVSTTIGGAIFLASVVVQCRKRTDVATFRSFYASIAYLGILLAAIVAETLLTGL